MARTKVEREGAKLNLAERLFEAEADLRAAALHFSLWDSSHPESKDRAAQLNLARTKLRTMARKYSRLAAEVERL